jgi:7-cyano-7-deazaguanine synthase in queuosine biosynthesis
MGKFALITKLGLHDAGVSVDRNEYAQTAEIKILVNRDKNEVKLDQLFMELKRLKLQPSELAMDLLIIACSMYGADTRIDRLKTADDSWTRQIDLFIPVSDPVAWDLQKERLKKIFRFLTGDIWNIKFRSRTDLPEIAPKTNRKKYGMPYETDTVCLFSGGMDSFIGAINLISAGIHPLLLGHAKSSDVSPNQKFCEAAIRQAFPNVPLKRIYAFVRVPKKNMFDGDEKTERGRSFLFLTLGGICASALSPDSKLIVPENGLISLNLPLTPLRAGSHSTRTTHPHYISLMQELFNELQLGVVISNPYQFKTKGEMLSECAKPDLVRATKTMSCSHPSGRFQKLGNGHCGYCVPCIIRQAAFKKANVAEIKDYRIDIFDDGSLDSATKKDNIIAFNYLLGKLRRKPDFLKSLIRVTGPLGNNVDDYVAIYSRGLSEVEALLSDVAL